MSVESFEDTTVRPPATVPPAHLGCALCYPEWHFGMKAICGTELLGIKCRDDAPLCKSCEAEVPRHLLNHAMNRRS